MTFLPRCVLLSFLIPALWVFCAAPCFGQPLGLSGSATRAETANSPGSQQGAPATAAEGPDFQHIGLGTYESPLGFGGKIAMPLAQPLVLRAGASYFSFSSHQTASGIPFTANVVLQSEQAQVDWYPFFHRSFHISPGVQFGNSSRIYGDALIAAGKSFTLNGTTYYSGAAGPVQAEGSARFRRTSPMLTAGWGNWVRREGQGHWAFPFEFGAIYNAAPATVLNFTGVVCADPGELYCQNIANDASVQANIQAERVKMRKDANYLRFYPILAGGIVYRF